MHPVVIPQFMFAIHMLMLLKRSLMKTFRILVIGLLTTTLKVMLLGTDTKTSKGSHIHVGLCMDNMEVENVTCYKYLGVYIDVN